MRLKCLGCEALARLLYTCAAQSPHLIDIELFKLGLHNRPFELRDKLQERIYAVPTGEYDALVLGYGICGQATLGLVSPHLPMIIPRAHDCITLYLGDRLRYKTQFEEQPGTYWYTVDYLERHKTGDALGATSASTDLANQYEEFVRKFGQDNADYLMEVMGTWHSHYQRAVFIDMGVGDPAVAEDRAREIALRRGWLFERLTGDLVLIRKLLMGEWDDHFLRLAPGETIGMSYDDAIIECVKPS
jgi:hypothetical protein